VSASAERTAAMVRRERERVGELWLEVMGGACVGKQSIVEHPERRQVGR